MSRAQPRVAREIVGEIPCTARARFTAPGCPTSLSCHRISCSTRRTHSAFLGFIPLPSPSVRSPTTFDGCYEPRRVANAPRFRHTIYLFPSYDSGANAAGIALSTCYRQRICSPHHHPFNADADVACGHWILPWQMAGHEPALPLPVSTGDSLRMHGPVLVDAFET